MSGNYVQRGDTAVMDKFERAKPRSKRRSRSGNRNSDSLCAVFGEFYAKGAIYILDSLGCVDEISFGSEAGSVSELEKAAEIADDAPERLSLKNTLKAVCHLP